MNEQPPKRQRLLGMATALRSVKEEPQRRRAVLGLIRAAALPEPDPSEPTCSESEIFAAAYNDPDGAAYWQSSIDAYEHKIDVKEVPESETNLLCLARALEASIIADHSTKLETQMALQREIASPIWRETPIRGI
jgi:hypothetical protein